MAFDWTQVEGYKEEMSAEEKLALLENYEAPKPAPIEDKPAEPDKPANMKGYIPKAQFDKLSSELAAAKKQLRTRLSEEEQKELDRQAQAEAMEQELKELRYEKTVSRHTADFLAQGYDQGLAEEAAKAMADGDSDTLFAIMKKQQSAAEKAMRAKILKETPVPPAGDDHEEDKNLKQINELRKYAGLPPLMK